MAEHVTALAAVPGTSDNTLSANAGGLQMGSVSIGWQDTSHWWPVTPLNNYSYTTTWASPPLNPTEKAFRIVSLMMEQELVGELSVKEFVALVNNVAEIVRTN